MVGANRKGVGMEPETVILEAAMSKVNYSKFT